MHEVAHYVGEVVSVESPLVVGQGTIIAVDAETENVMYKVKIFEVESWFAARYIKNKVDW